MVAFVSSGLRVALLCGAVLAVMVCGCTERSRDEMRRGYGEGRQQMRDRLPASQPAPTTADAPTPPRHQYGACPVGGHHTVGKVDRRGRTHCAKCGRYMTP